MDYLITPAAFIFILGSAVVLHEFGHFIVAKLLGIRVETFSVGFGPKLFGKKIGHTDYRVSAIPLGGYVKLGGDESNAPLEGQGASDIPPGEMFNLRPRYQRIMVALAGPVMNIITAMAIPFVGAMIYGIPATPSPVVSYVTKSDAADQAGLKPGDRIISFNGTSNPTWDSINGDALLSPGQSLPLVVNRNGEEVALNIRPTPRTENGETAGFLEFIPDYGGLPVVVNAVSPSSPAEESGFQSGDRVLAVGSEPVKSAAQITEYIHSHDGQPIPFEIERKGQKTELTSVTRRLPGALLGLKLGEEFPLHKVGVGSGIIYAY